ncbi:hypothetical protein AB0M10_18390 [Streptomyces sp. NPDC051840]|uniref:hypothetical protein n=1 Tax=unclassified Streptomyces TaxID=2593676 RepID=UPI00342018E1
MPVRDASLKDWLRAERAVNGHHLEIMGLHYDLTGALAAGQHGLAWSAQQSLLVETLRVRLAYAGVACRTAGDRVTRAFAVMEATAAMDAALADDAWELWLRPMPPDDEIPEALEEVRCFVADRLGLPWARDRAAAVRRWAENTNDLRTVARRLGMAQSDDWYVSEKPESTPDWYAEVLAALEAEDS